MSIPNEDRLRDMYDRINPTSANSPYNEDWDMDPDETEKSRKARIKSERSNAI
jgi:hypothetical protein